MLEMQKSFRFRKSDAGKTIWPPFSFRHKMRSMWFFEFSAYWKDWK